MNHHGNHDLLAQLQGDFPIIATITTLEELDGYEAEARRQGMKPGQVAAIEERRRVLRERAK